MTLTLSVVSHRQGPLVTELLRDLVRIGSKHVSAIVVTLNVPEAPIEVPHGLDATTTFVDNPAPQGFGANHNAAFRHCRTPLFAVLNPDLRLPTDPFASLMGRLDADAGLAMVAPLIVATDGRPEDAARELITPLRLLRRRLAKRANAPAADPDWLAGMFMLIRSETFAALGGFDARYFMYCEDFDLCARLRLAGWRFEVQRGVAVVHDARRDSHRSLRHLGWHVASLLKMWTSSAFWRYRSQLERATP